MRDVYLGDTYDFVKRFWSESLLRSTLGKLYAHPDFIRPEIREPFTSLNRIPILESRPEQPFGMLFDPDTGIPLPTKLAARATVAHAPLPFIVETNEKFRPDYMICFDQSFHRRPGFGKEAQREEKKKYPCQQGISSFYYISHAPFLFMAQRTSSLRAVREHLISEGIPVKIGSTILLQALLKNAVE